MLHKALSSFLCVRVWFLSTGPKRAAQRQQWNLGLQARRQYSRGLISSSIYGPGTGVEPCTHTSSSVSSHEGRFGLSIAQIPVFSNFLIQTLFPFLFSIPIKYLSPITCVFSGKRCSGVCKRRKDYIFPMFLNAWTEQTHFDCKNTGNRN